jgi:flavin-dependent dehydrogenase
LSTYRGGKKVSDTHFESEDPVVIDREDFEKGWFEEIKNNVDLRVEEVDEEKFVQLTNNFDLVIDASGPKPISEKVLPEIDSTDKYMRTVSTTLEGDLSDHYPYPSIIASKDYLMYVTTKSDSKATVGIGWYYDQQPDNPLEEFNQACREVGLPVKQKKHLRLGLEPLQGSRKPNNCVSKMNGASIRLVGDAAGLVNPLNRFGNLKASKSGKKAVKADSNEEYEIFIDELNGIMPITGRLFEVVQNKLGYNDFTRAIVSGKSSVKQENFLETYDPKKGIYTGIRLVNGMIKNKLLG